MLLKPQQIQSSLANKLAPVYLVAGDEPLQLAEVTDGIRKAAKKEGYLSREVFSVDKDFTWNQLNICANSLSIFADKKIIDLKMPLSKPGVEGGKAISDYCKQLPKDTLLIITAAKIDKATLKSKWVSSINQVGIVVQIWPIEGSDLIRWLQQRAQSKALQIEHEGIKVLASRVEGNLLVAAQEIEKLYVLYGNSSITKQAVEQAVADNARFDVFKLSDCILSGQINRIIKILTRLKQEGIVEAIVLWALTREARMLISIKIAINQGENKASMYNKYRLWDKRKQLVDKALSRLKMNDLDRILLLCCKADRQIKGQEKGDSWETLFAICLHFSTANPIKSYVA